MANVIEILDVDPEELGVEEDGAHVDLDSQRKGIVQKCLDGSYCYQNSFCFTYARRKAINFLCSL